MRSHTNAHRTGFITFGKIVFLMFVVAELVATNNFSTFTRPLPLVRKKSVLLIWGNLYYQQGRMRISVIYLVNMSCDIKSKP